MENLFATEAAQLLALNAKTAMDKAERLTFAEKHFLAVGQAIALTILALCEEVGRLQATVERIADRE